MQLGNRQPRNVGDDPGCWIEGFWRGRMTTLGEPALLFFIAMTAAALDRQLQNLFREGIDDAFVDWCKATLPLYSCAPTLAPVANKYADAMQDAMIMYSGYQSEQYPDIYAAAQKMKQQELRGGRWVAMPAEEKAAADLIAHRAFDDLQQAEADGRDASNLTFVLGLYVYMTILCSPVYNVESFRRLFVLSWLIYFSEILSVPIED